jgi:hypothetical protein
MIISWGLDFGALGRFTTNTTHHGNGATTPHDDNIESGVNAERGDLKYMHIRI